jgi:HK97 family phage major capsid protein
MNMNDLVHDMQGLRADIQAAREHHSSFASIKAAAQNVEQIRRDAEEARQSDKGLELASVVRAFAAAGGKWEGVPGVIAEGYKNPSLAKQVEKTLSGLTAGAGGYLVAEKWSAELIPLLRAAAVCLRAGARQYPMTNAIEHIPSLASGSTAYWMGDTDAITTSQPVFGQKNMSEKYLAALVPIRNNLIRSSSPAADVIVRDEIVQTMALALDNAILQGSGSSNQPRGIKNSSPTAYTVSSRIRPDDPVGFLEKLYSENVSNMAAPGWVFNSRVWRDLMNLRDNNGRPLFAEEMRAGNLMGIPYHITQQISNAGDAHQATDVYLGDFNEVLVGERIGSSMQLAISDSASFSSGGNMVSAFQNNITLVRAMFVGDVLLRQPKAFVVSTDVYTV